MPIIDDPHHPATPRPAYPLDVADGNDPRFTLGVVIDIAGVLAAHGYPPITAGADIVRLQQALYGYLYGAAELANAEVSE